MAQGSMEYIPQTWALRAGCCGAASPGNSDLPPQLQVDQERCLTRLSPEVPRHSCCRWPAPHRCSPSAAGVTSKTVRWKGRPSSRSLQLAYAELNYTASRDRGALQPLRSFGIGWTGQAGSWSSSSGCWGSRITLSIEHTARTVVTEPGRPRAEQLTASRHGNPAYRRGTAARQTIASLLAI